MKDNQFVFVTPAFNCKEKIKNTIFSMTAQSYKNWRAVIIDDVSTDDTGEFVKDFVKNIGFEEKFEIKTRKEKYGEVRNTLEENFHLKDNDIVVRLDAGDWLTENDCLYMLNQIYNQYSPSVLWTAHRWAFTDHNISGNLNLSNQFPDVYKHPWVSSHLKTFRSEKLKRVPEKNFFDDEGNYIMIACDQAIFLPMMHMSVQSKENLIYFPRVCYHYDIDLNKPNLFSDTNERSYAQKMSAEWIRERGFVN